MQPAELPTMDFTHNLDGRIPLCPHQGCAFRCCSFQQNNYILLYPGEVEESKAQNKSLSHLELLSAYEGGYKAVCKAKDTSTCDHGYKPLDCKSYPYFPVAKNGRIEVGLKGRKCPLPDLEFHRRYVVDVWSALSRTNGTIYRWLQRVKLVGYEKVS